MGEIFKKTTATPTKFSNISAKEMLKVIMDAGTEQIMRKAQEQESIDKDLNAMAEAITEHLVAQSVKSELVAIFDSFKEKGFAEADLFQPGLSNNFIELSEYSSVTYKFGAFLEDGIFGLGTMGKGAGDSSPIADMERIDKASRRTQVELKAIVGSSDLNHMLKVGGMTIYGTAESVTNKAVQNIAATYKVLMKMQNLFLMEFDTPPRGQMHRITPMQATLFWELIVKNLVKLVKSASKKGPKSELFQIVWDKKPKAEKDGTYKMAVMIHFNTKNILSAHKIVQLYMRQHVFFDSKGVHGVDPRIFFGEIRHMSGI